MSELRFPADKTPRVLLVDPYQAARDPMERKFLELYPSLGVLTLGAYLRTHGTKVRILDLTFERGLGRTRSLIREFQPHLIGVHTKTLTMPRALEIAHLGRTEGAVTVAGGPDASTRPAAYLAGGFDVIAMGEGEETLLELGTAVAAREPFDAIPGLVTPGPSPTEVVRAAPRAYLKSLDALPLPAWDLIDMEGYLRRWEARTGERRAAILTSRGCPFDCSWCSKPTFGRSFRQQSPERVLAELEELRNRYHVDYVRFCDDVFGIDRHWLLKLLDGMEARRLDLRFECLARVDLLRPELLDRLKQAGLQRVYLGVESGSQTMLDAMNRGTRLSQIERTSTALRAAGVRQFWFLMLGYPGERLEDIEATLRLFRKFAPDEYSLSIAVPIPGTRFHDLVRDRLRSERARGTKGGMTLLYDGAFPQSLYRWEQRRFRWEAALRRLEGRMDANLLAGLRQAADQFHETVAKPLLLGHRGIPRHPRPHRARAERPRSLATLRTSLRQRLAR